MRSGRCGSPWACLWSGGVRGRSPKRKSVLALLGVAGAAAVGLPIAALAGPGGQPPDLRADPPEAIGQPETFSSGIGAGRLLVRFNGYVTNVGTGPIELRGNPQVPGSVRQYARSAPGQPVDIDKGAPPVIYEAGDGHFHWHLMNAMRYSLWNKERTAEVAPGQKAGFCLYDSERAPGDPPVSDGWVYTESVTRFCESLLRGHAGPNATSLRMGVSAGMRDLYDRSLAYQWVDVSDTAPGDYRVAAQADPNNVIWEGGGAAEVNPPAWAGTPVIVPGYVAQPAGVAQTGAPQTTALPAPATYGDPGAARFRLVTPPAHGTVSVGPGQAFTYTPKPGYLGSDTFIYTAWDPASPFPFNPPTAAVGLIGNTVAVGISGAPPSLPAGTSAQLSATVVNAPGGVSWSVNGVAGGNAEVGTVTPQGLYVAPAAPPPGGAAVIRAQSLENPEALGHAAIAITPPPKRTPAPSVAGKLSAGNKLLSKLKVGRVGRRIVVGKVVTGRRAGKVTITATFKRKVLGRCVARVGPRKAFVCKVRLKRNYPLKKVRLTAKFTVSGKTKAVRRAWAVTPRRR